MLTPSPEIDVPRCRVALQNPSTGRSDRQTSPVRWHRKGFAAYRRWRSGSPGGRPRIAKEVPDLMSFENPLWGAIKIPGELLKLGIEVAQGGDS